MKFLLLSQEAKRIFRVQGASTVSERDISASDYIVCGLEDMHYCRQK